MTALFLAAWLGAAQAPEPPPLVWGGDAEGGAPFVEADPADPAQVRGFDVEIAETIARGLGRRARFVQVQWSSIDQSVERGDFALGLSGVEDTPARRARHAVTIPYFEFREVLAVRPEDRTRYPDLAALRGRVAGGSAVAAAAAPLALPASAWAYLPALGRAALVTALLSTLAMALAVALGLGVAASRVYGPAPLRAAAVAYVEAIRGTPLLLQLFVIYYGLSGWVRLPAFLAAVLGLGLNYAAYEAEIYRGALEAVPRAQLEAARTLGFSEAQIFRLVRGPQALRYALAPMTNDFVALLKDSSLVSVLTVVELTKQTAIYATNIGSWVVPGLLCAAVYLAMSLPLARLGRRLERRWRLA